MPDIFDPFPQKPMIKCSKNCMCSCHWMEDGAAYEEGEPCTYCGGTPKTPQQPAFVMDDI
tara:strand:+ start:226 stop:405 length:180 start_codon:yes stop_codon:yes gene_type:complete